MEIRIPPLRERPEDIRQLVPNFLDELARKYSRDCPSVTARGWQRLMEHSWPGNVRELRQAVERAIITTRTPALDAADFHLVTPPSERAESAPTGEVMTLEALEHAAVTRALTRHSGNVTKAAAELGITRSALYRRMEKYGL